MTVLAIPTEYEIAEFRGLCTRVGDAVEAAVYGKRQVVDLLLVSLFAGGHVLIEDVPGTGKTTLARSLAAALGASPLVGAIGIPLGVLAFLIGLLLLLRTLRSLRHRKAGARGAWSEVLDLLPLLRIRPSRWHTADRIAADLAERCRPMPRGAGAKRGRPLEHLRK